MSIALPPDACVVAANLEGAARNYARMVDIPRIRASRNGNGDAE